MPTKQQQVNQRMLEGKDPLSAATGIADVRPDKLARRAVTAIGIVERNRLNFEAIQAEELAPYRTLYAAMMSACLKSPKKVEYEEVIYDRDGQPVMYFKDGAQVVRTVTKWREDYEEVPNWPVRIQAARNILTLQGADPKYDVKVNVGTGPSGTGVNVSFGDVILQIGSVDSYEDKVAEYGRMKQSVQRGEIDAVIEADFEVPPIGGDSNKQSIYDDLPPERF